MMKYHTKLKGIEQDIEDGKVKFTGKAFVTFMFEKDWQIALKTLTRPKGLEKSWNKLRHLLWFYVPRSREPLLGKKIIVKRPEEPQDIIWENLGEDENVWKIKLEKH